MEQNKNPLEARNKIISLLKIRGPSLPVHISKEIGLSTLFSGAFLSELASNNEIKISNLKVGGSPLYFIPGQENQLEKFSSYLPGKEKQAFLLLKRKKLLQDSKLAPVMRVALRNLKDFAFPIALNTLKGQELFWRFYNFSEEEALTITGKTEKKKMAEEPTLEIIKKTEKRGEEKPEPTLQIIKKAEIEKPLLTLKPTITRRASRKEKSDFAKSIISLLNRNNIEILEEKETKKREYQAVIRINSDIGRLSFLVIAKDKKGVSENDLTIALQKAQSLKMPALFLSPGELNKKALSYLEQYSSLLKFKKLA